MASSEANSLATSAVPAATVAPAAEPTPAAAVFLDADPAASAATVSVNHAGARTAQKQATDGGTGGGGHQGGSVSWNEFQVALGELRRSIGVVRGESAHISTLIGQVEKHFGAAHGYWRSPSATSFETMSDWFSRSSRELEALLQEMVHRMQVAYDNYASAERANTRNSGG